ncbi:hypothetical protein JVX88_02605 [Leptolyngbya sp. 7M]|nr:helix-turn-helix domain-containing protein [Leptolyngbya sp. 7M]QYO65699.1 hypothetical protein JVX88_02605 [Leptolyngbya sp. 7M]
MTNFFTSHLSETDPFISEAIDNEVRRQADGLELIASENFVSEAVLQTMGTVFTNKYAEGYPGKRYYGGCEFADVVEQAAIDRAKQLYREKTGRHVSGISREAKDALLRYHWPGNVRELENAIERAVIIASGRQIELEDLPETVASVGLSGQAGNILYRATEGRRSSVGFEVELPATMEEVEERTIKATLDFTEGDKSRAARLLKIGRKTLYRKLEQYGTE